MASETRTCRARAKPAPATHDVAGPFAESEPRSSGTRMAWLVAGAQHVAARAQDKPQPVRPGERQPELDASRMATPEKGRGAQKPKGPSAPPEGQHVRLVLRITEAGDSEVVGVAQLPGRAVLSEVGTGDFVVEVVSDGSTIAAQAIPDPFERRSFAGPEGSPIQGHHVERAKTATVTIRVPDMTLGTPGLERLSVRFYNVRPGTPISKIDASEMRRLREENRLERRFEIPASRLAPQIRERARAPKIE